MTTPPFASFVPIVAFAAVLSSSALDAQTSEKLSSLGARGSAPDLEAASSVHDHMERPLITGRHGVVTSLNPLSSMAGMKILMKGGNAFDAAIATAIATTVVDPQDSSIGGHGFATIYVAKDRQVRALNYYGTAPGAATVETLKGKAYADGYLSSPVPSDLKGYEVLHKAYGSLPWSEVLEPAIDLAENGFAATKEFVAVLSMEEPHMNYPSTRRVFFPNGRAPRVGEIFRQPDLARTLRRVAQEGADAFYKGGIARKIADFYHANGGLISYEDLARYQAKWVDPISTTYRGYTVFTQPPNSSGIAILIQLNLLEAYDLKALGHNSPRYLHLIGEVQRLAIADRNRYVADPAFVSVPIARLVSKEYAAERRKLISMDKTMPAVPPPASLGGPDRQNTSHLTVVDAAGNMASMTQTLGSWYGSGVVAADTGVLFSNEMRHLHTDPDSPSKVAPGRRPRSNQSPLIVLKNGQPVMAIGTPGSDGIWQRLPQILVNIFDFGMDIQEAIAEPRMIYGGYQETGTDLPPVFAVEDRIPAGTASALESMGYKIKLIPSDDGCVNGIMRDPATGFLYGGADPRRLGASTGWWGPAYAVYAVGW